MTQKLQNTRSRGRVSHDEGICRSPPESPKALSSWPPLTPTICNLGLRATHEVKTRRDKTTTPNELRQRLLTALPGSQQTTAPGHLGAPGLDPPAQRRRRAAASRNLRGSAGARPVGFGRAGKAETGLRGRRREGPRGKERRARVGKGRGPRRSPGQFPPRPPQPLVDARLALQAPGGRT